MESHASARLTSNVSIALQRLRSEIKWKAGKDTKHLETRIAYGHLSPTATLEEYEFIIAIIIRDKVAQVYAYTWPDETYVAIIGVYGYQRWLVISSMMGIMETAFPPTDPDEYLADPRFHYVGTIQELLG